MSDADLEAISASRWCPAKQRRIPPSLNAATVDRIVKILNHRQLVRCRVHELDVEARYVASNNNREVPGQLHVLLSREDAQVSFFCLACKRKHYHGVDAGGAGAGHRVAHCTVTWSPYFGRGYVLVEKPQ